MGLAVRDGGGAGTTGATPPTVTATVVTTASSRAGVTPSGRVRGSGVAASRTRTLPAFTAVDLVGTNRVTVHVGASQSVTVHGDDNLLGLVTTTVRAGTLSIGERGRFRSKIPMQVVVTVPRLVAVTLSGTGVVFVDGVAADRFRVRVPGHGVLTVGGTTRTLDAELSGTGDVRLDGLAARNATATVSGSGRLEVDASRSLRATVSGVGAIVYSGSPSQIATSVTGTGTITRR